MAAADGQVRIRSPPSPTFSRCLSQHFRFYLDPYMMYELTGDPIAIEALARGALENLRAGGGIVSGYHEEEAGVADPRGGEAHASRLGGVWRTSCTQRCATHALSGASVIVL